MFVNSADLALLRYRRRLLELVKPPLLDYCRQRSLDEALGAAG